MRKTEIVAKIREFSKYLPAEAVKRQIMVECNITSVIYDNILAKFINGPKTEAVITEIDGQNVVDLHHLICELAQLKRENKGKFDKLSIRGKIQIVGESKLK